MIGPSLAPGKNPAKPRNALSRISPNEGRTVSKLTERGTASGRNNATGKPERFRLKLTAACQRSPAHPDAHYAVRQASGTPSPTYQRKGNLEIVKITKVQSRVLSFRNQVTFRLVPKTKELRTDARTFILRADFVLRTDFRPSHRLSSLRKVADGGRLAALAMNRVSLARRHKLAQRFSAG